VAQFLSKHADAVIGALCGFLTAVEPCLSYEIVRDPNAKRLQLVPRHRKCLFLYHDQIHPVLGFMHARIQTWFPFSIQICRNGRAWLARSMNAAGIGYLQRDTCFTWLEQPKRAQPVMDEPLRAAWPDLLDAIARSLNPLHEAMFQACPIEYYGSTYQSEWATDILFRDAPSLARLYPKLVHHGLTTFLSPDVMRLLGRKIPPSNKLPPRLEAEVVSTTKVRPEGLRIKHRLGQNSIRMYDNIKPCPRALDRGRGACCGSRPRSTIQPTSNRSARRKVNLTPPRPGTACAGGSPTGSSPGSRPHVRIWP
jgi:hypothetical protein